MKLETIVFCGEEFDNLMGFVSEPVVDLLIDEKEQRILDFGFEGYRTKIGNLRISPIFKTEYFQVPQTANYNPHLRII